MKETFKFLWWLITSLPEGISDLTQEPMKIPLYKLPMGAKIKCELVDESKYLIFNRLDGMYSHCTTEKGNTTHLYCGTEFTKNDDGSYNIAPKDE